MNRILTFIAGAACLALMGGCATRGTISELGHPEFQDAVPEGTTLTLPSPARDDQFFAFSSDAQDGGDYRATALMTESPRREGGFVIMDLNAQAKGDRKLDSFQVLVYPMTAGEELAMKLKVQVPKDRKPIATARADKPLPGRGYYHVDLKIPLSDVGDAAYLGLPSLVRFEDGSVAIIPVSTPVPPPP